MEAPRPAAGDGGPRSESGLERRWLREASGFVRRALLGGSQSEEPAEGEAWRGLTRALRRGGELPLACRFISISELQSQQRQPCCSHLTWSSDEFRKWACESKGVFPDQSILQRAPLILIGYLADRKKDSVTYGSLHVQDNTGVMPCEVLHFKLEWLETLLLFPSWTYIPQRGQNRAGYLEILADPVPVMPGPEKTISTFSVLDPGQAAKLLSARAQGKKLAELNVAGEVSRLSTVLSIHQKVVFFLFLKCFDSDACVPVLVRTPHLVWRHVLQLGHSYVLTALKISSLKASGLRVFVTRCSSHLLPYCTEHVTEQFVDSSPEGSSVSPAPPSTCMLLSSSSELGEEDKMPVPVRKSKVVSYAGTITRVLNVQASLYELDNKFTLCLAYQQQLNSGRGLRPGARVELRDLHLLQKPYAAYPFVFGACFHTTVVLKSFSTRSTLHQPVACSGNLYMHLLLRYNLTLPLYLCLVSLLETLELRFHCFIQRQQLLLCSGHNAVGAAEKFIVPILSSLMPSKKQVRDIHREILAETHHCPLQQYQILHPPCQIPPFSVLFAMVEERCLERFSPSHQMSAPEIQHVGAQELNRRLAWSYCMFSPEDFQPQVVLLGILRASSSSGFLRLQDSTKALPCVIFHKDGRAFADTSLIGCLLQIEKFQLVAEQFLHSDFPSWQELEMPEYVKEKTMRLYVQFFVEDVKVLHSPEKRAPEVPKICPESSSVAKDNRSATAGPGSLEGNVPSTEGAHRAAGTPELPGSFAAEARSVSRLFLVTQKEGLMCRNYLQASEGNGKDGQGRQLCFQATVIWMSEPEHYCGVGEAGGQKELCAPVLRETSEAQPKVSMLFLQKSVRWFPLLHPGGLYQLVLPQCWTLDVFDKFCQPVGMGKLSSMKDCSLSFVVPDTGYLYHLSQIFQLASEMSDMAPKLLSVAEILSPSFTGSLVSFSGVIVERTHTGKKPITACPSKKQKGNLLPGDHTVKLSVSPAHDSSVRLDVYIGATFLPHLWGTLPGAKIQFHNLSRKISRFKNVYCTYVATSCLRILSPPPPASSSWPVGGTSTLPAVYLSHLLIQPPSLQQVQVTCHLTCVLTLSLSWACSFCGSIVEEGRWKQHNPSCSSHSGVIQARARILVEDGTGEAAVSCKNQQVREVLGLSPKEWDVVQTDVQRKGFVSIQNNSSGARPGCTEEPEDLLTRYLRSLCKSPVVCRPLVLAARLDRNSLEAGSGQARRFFGHEIEFLSQTRNRLNLICMSIQEAT